MNRNNRLTKILNIDHPFIQAPMLGVTTPEMVAAISNAGALGSLPIGNLPADKASALIQQTKNLTRKPFAVNLFANTFPSPVNENTWNAMQDFLEQFSEQYQLSHQKQKPEALKFYSYEEQVEILIKENIPAVSFTFGILSDDVIAELHKHNAQLTGTATSVEEAIFLSDKGIDIITAQGIEAGGHRGTFLHKDIPQVGLMALLPQVISVVDKPVVAAGAIADGRSINAAMQLGAEGVQVGSAFIACKESAANATYKEAVQHITGADTTLTKSYTGRWLRCINNEFIQTIESSGLHINEYPIQQALTQFLRTLHQDKNAMKFLPMLTGQNVRKSFMKGAAEIFMDMMKEAGQSSTDT